MPLARVFRRSREQVARFLRLPRRGLRPREEFFLLLAHERAIADRCDNQFTVIAWTARDKEAPTAPFSHLTRLLDERLRITDIASQLDEGCIAVLLPRTPAAGAWKVADDITLGFPLDCPPPVCHVYVYPSRKRSDVDDWETAATEDLAPGKVVQGLEPFFVRAVPLAKRVIDIVGSAAAMLTLFPLLALVGLAVKCTSRGPVLFVQRRSGHGGRVFWMYKFRSMIADADNQRAQLKALNEYAGPTFKIKNDPRTTWFGRLLRKTSLDELPQLWNVLRGDMSLVGPRPLPCDEAAGCHGWRRTRENVVPGLTCIWQLDGREKASYEERMRMDVRYVHRWSMKEDLRLILRTALKLLLRPNGH
jgi:lipopolysaccharide/colanic/teichoic acid biosynthesis glycosyltransferase